MNDFKKSLEVKVKNIEQRQIAIDKMFNLLSEQFDAVRKSDLDSEAKNIQSDVILDLMKFLMNYEKNIEILNEHIRKEKYMDR